MTREEAWLRVARECPRRILGSLHRCGDYHHGTTARFPGKVLCCHRSTTLPPGWQPTPAQEAAWQAEEEAARVESMLGVAASDIDHDEPWTSSLTS
jgi:hypothetical protein